MEELILVLAVAVKMATFWFPLIVSAVLATLYLAIIEGAE